MTVFGRAGPSASRAKGAFVRFSKKRWKGRAHGASPEDIFEGALFGEEVEEREPSRPRDSRKALQLCRQAQRAIMFALSGECRDELLRDLYVDSVEPMGGGGQLLVRVVVPHHITAMTPEVLQRLEAHAPQLRAAVAQSICRKRAPSLSFTIAPIAPISEDTP
jgi:ribosome-binding factor A